MYLMHYGIPGMKWGVRRTPEQLGRHKTPRQLVRSLQKLKYKEFTRLMSPKAVEKTHRGSCHDQVMYEMDELQKMGKKPKAMFVMEYNKNGQGGMTHSFVYYKEGKKTVWLENAWRKDKETKSLKQQIDMRAFRKQVIKELDANEP